MYTNRPAFKTDTPQETQIKKAPLTDLEREFFLIRDGVQKILINNNENLQVKDTDRLRTMIQEAFTQVLKDENILYNHATRRQMQEWITADIIGYGPLEPLLNDPEITEIMVNGHEKVYIERHGLIESTLVNFENEAHLLRVIDRIVSRVGRRVDEASPMVDARLPNGYRINAIIPPLSLDGPILTIRKFSSRPFTAEDLVAMGTLTGQVVEFVRCCVEARVNLVVSGGTGTGKTTFLNVLSSFIPQGERVITIEDTAELQLHQPHVVRLEKRPPNVEMRGEVTIRQLVINALRMRPDRIVVGECRSGEALDMLQAMNTGHDGSMTTIHANSPRDALRRIETMVLMAGMELPLKAIREQVASSIELIVQLERLRDGTRKITRVSSIEGMEGDTIVMQDLFLFKQSGLVNDFIKGDHVPTGLRPHFIEKFAANNVKLPASLFED